MVKNCRNIGKKDMKFNDAMPEMKVDPESYVSTLMPLVGQSEGRCGEISRFERVCAN